MEELLFGDVDSESRYYAIIEQGISLGHLKRHSLYAKTTADKSKSKRLKRAKREAKKASRSRPMEDQENLDISANAKLPEDNLGNGDKVTGNRFCRKRKAEKRESALVLPCRKERTDAFLDALAGKYAGKSGKHHLCAGSITEDPLDDVQFEQLQKKLFSSTNRKRK